LSVNGHEGLCSLLYMSFHKHAEFSLTQLEFKNAFNVLDCSNRIESLDRICNRGNDPIIRHCSVQFDLCLYVNPDL